MISEKPNGVVLHCQIQPRASKTEIVGPHGEPPRLRIRVAAPPVDGAANEELIAFLSKKLKVSKRQIEITTGESGKFKDIFVQYVKASDVRSALSLAPSP